MSKGFDCADQLMAPVANMFRRDGNGFVARYLVPTGWKRLTKSEAKIISLAGLQIVSVFETTDNRALGGYEAGREDGVTASQLAADIGQPDGSCIYFAVDFAPADSDMETVMAYIRGANEASPNYATGVYGSYDVIEAAVQAGVCSHYWQTLAWSRGLKSDHANIYQNDTGSDGNGIQQNGILIDEDESYGNEGWWNTLSEPVKKTNFPDVEAGRWSEGAIAAVSQLGLMTGYEDGTFRPSQAVTREELAKVLNDVIYLVNAKTGGGNNA